MLSEKDKMLTKQLYNANDDEELEKERVTCKTLCQQYNQMPIDQLDKRKTLLKMILGKTEKHLHIEPDFWCDYGYNISVGENFYANHHLTILDAGRVTFGDNVFIGPSCGFYTSGHPIDYIERNKGLEYAYPITIGNNVWFGAGVQVMPGVIIGNDVVIGSGSVVVKDIPSHSVAVGNPCKVIRQITQ